MSIPTTHRLACTWLLAMTVSSMAIASPTLAADVPATGLTRQHVVAELLATLRTHRWDEPSGQWVAHAPERPGAEGRTRSEVRAELAVFTSSYRWDESQGGWIPRTATGRDAGGLTRAEVAASTLLFLETHDWDEPTQLWSEHVRVPRVR